MAVNHITLAEVDRVGADVAKAYHTVVEFEKDRLRTRMLVRTVANIRHQTVAVVYVHDLWKRQVQCDLLRDTQLIQLDVRIRSND